MVFFNINFSLNSEINSQIPFDSYWSDFSYNQHHKQACRKWSVWGIVTPPILAKVDLLPTDNDIEKKKRAKKKYKLVQISRKLLVTLLVSISRNS